VLEYLVTSRARRELLRLLWLESREDSARALAEQARLSSTLANRELKAMVAAGLARSRVDGAATLYRAATDHRHGELLRALLETANRPAAPDEHAPDKRAQNNDRAVRASLANLGAPLLVGEADRDAPSDVSVEQLVVDGLDLARRDPTVTRAFPVLLSRLAESLDFARLGRLARERGHRQTLGFLAELTSTLRGGDRELSELARGLRDHRVSVDRPFFDNRPSRFDEELMALRTPDVARRWHFQMNMSLDDFQAFYDKHSSP
jgi:hypothetical protein